MQRLNRFWLTALFLLTFGLYLATLTQVHTFDALSYILSVERKPWPELFHPHHLAYGPLGALALNLARAIGYPAGAAVPMQSINALAGAAGVTLFAWVAKHQTQRTDLGLVTGLLLASSYAYWYYAIEVEVYTVATLFLVGCLALLSQTSKPTPARMALLGLAQGAAVLFHQTNLLLCLPIAVWWVLQHTIDQRAVPARQRLRTFLLGGIAYTGTLALIVVGSYFWVGFGISRFENMATLNAWMTEYARTGWWGAPITAEKWGKLAKGLAETLTTSWGGWALAGLVAIAFWVNRNRKTSQASHSLPALLVAWLLVYGAFFFWWEPDNIEFWIASLPPALLLFARTLQHTKPWSLPILAALGIALAMGATNLEAINRRGDASTDLQRTIAQALAQQSTPADLLIVPDGLQELYLPYYHQREYFLSINQALFDAGADWNAACTLIQQRIETARYAGATALIATEALQPPTELLTRHRLSQSQIDSCFAAYRSELRSIPMPTNAPAYLRLPFAQEYADTSGWQFSQTALGWQSANVSSQTFAEGWRMQAGTDPYLTSPLLRIDASQIRTIELELAATTNARDAQLFFLGENGLANEDQSIRWQLSPGHEVQRYRLAVGDLPGWQGIITRIRIDPVGIGDGGEIRLIAVRFCCDAACCDAACCDARYCVGTRFSRGGSRHVATQDIASVPHLSAAFPALPTASSHTSATHSQLRPRS
jgi:hypothetical protein